MQMHCRLLQFALNYSNQLSNDAVAVYFFVPAVVPVITKTPLEKIIEIILFIRVFEKSVGSNVAWIFHPVRIKPGTG